MAGIIRAVHAVNRDLMTMTRRGVDEVAAADVHARVVNLRMVAGEVHAVAGNPLRPVPARDIVADRRLIAGMARQGDAVCRRRQP